MRVFHHTFSSFLTIQLSPTNCNNCNNNFTTISHIRLIQIINPQKVHAPFSSLYQTDVSNHGEKISWINRFMTGDSESFRIRKLGWFAATENGGRSSPWKKNRRGVFRASKQLFLAVQLSPGIESRGTTRLNGNVW